ncbi:MULTISPECIES: tyrosine-type recombinase/integrase [Pacificibacter]|uniref:tyrosine-type recombinase/integrase n=1 Tax=Pacificibacter TaxID=1042323 RepID=UPI001C08222C|nr:MULTISPECIES: site-specific integrase [Pacificibacter]MBU2937526.1 integrase arm-type DNA-binding domain-containing protein [Pacificibacter marinus]MDO6615706.1 integrase arm-type DNA-binding domain-containing protein [Pacificibacter sp. 1_MG-2023]
MGATNKLTAKGIAAAKVGKYNDGAGLWFYKRKDGGAQWFFRYTIHGGRKEMGFGAYPAVSLAEVRRKAVDAREQVRNGIDPIKEREKSKRNAARNLHLLSEIAHDTFETRKAQLKGDGVSGRWFSPLELHVLPKLGKMPVTEIDQVDIRDTLSPIWHTKSETARKALGRLAICIKHAAALGLPVDIQACEKAKALLGKPRHKAQHIPALLWQEVPEFYASLNDGSITHLALRFLILTGMRTGSVRFLHEDQVEGDLWTIPSENMKGAKDVAEDFRVPLSPQALQIIQAARQFSRDGHLFPSVKKGVISDATMARLMERRGMEARPHGFRTSLRVWVAETTDAPHEVAETLLAHSTGSKVVKAYRRTDFLEQRRTLLDSWAQFVSPPKKKIKLRRI